MDRRMKLLVKISEDLDKELLVSSQLYDGTPFQIKVPKYLVEVTNQEKNQAWIAVSVHGLQDGGKASVTLPAPILNAGHKVLIHAQNLQGFD